MVSDIYILAYTMLGWIDDEKPFHEYILEALPNCLFDHLPNHVDLVSVDYKKDELVNSLLYSFISEMSDSPIEPVLEKVDVESGYFHIRLDADEDLSMRRNETMEFIFSELHKFYYMIASFFCYLGDGEVHHFSSIHLEDLIEAVDDFEHKNLNQFEPLLRSYLCSGEIPDLYAGEVAKMMLMRDL